MLLHELGHTYLALRNGIPVRGISLFIFGGVAQISREPGTPGAEFRIAVAGPLTSLALAIVFGVLWLADQAIPYLAAPSMWLARINLMLALFNMIPGFPLDGGRVLRAVVWQITGSFYQATQVAAFSGQLMAFGFMGVGVFSLLGGSFFNGLWLVFIGWFLQNAAASSQAQSNLQRSLRGVTVGQVMTDECSRVPRQLSLQDLVDGHILAHGQRCFFVADEGELRGMLTLRDIAQVPRGEWGYVTTEKAMVPLERLIWIAPNSQLLVALQKMDDANVAQMPVVEGGRIVGMISREQILSYIRTRAELGV